MLFYVSVLIERRNFNKKHIMFQKLLRIMRIKCSMYELLYFL